MPLYKAIVFPRIIIATLHDRNALNCVLGARVLHSYKVHQLSAIHDEVTASYPVCPCLGPTTEITVDSFDLQGRNREGFALNNQRCHDPGQTGSDPDPPSSDLTLIDES